MSKNIVFEGWLTKSPPSKRIWRTKWRRRWFALRQSGELPGQYFLDYYADRNCRRLKGTINLDFCEQVDAGLHMERGSHGSLDPKLRGSVFTIQTQTRTYHLEADCEADMESWVDAICRVCGLRATDDSANAAEIYQNHSVTMGNQENIEMRVVKDNRSRKKTGKCRTVKSVQCNTISGRIHHQQPNMSNASTMTIEHYDVTDNTGPYIPISECITGVRAQNMHTHNKFNFESKTKVISNKKRFDKGESNKRRNYLSHPQIRINNVELSENDSNFSEEECRSLNASQSNIGDWKVAKTFTKLSLAPQGAIAQSEHGPPVPPRPPKTFAMSKELSLLQVHKILEPIDDPENNPQRLRVPRRSSHALRSPTRPSFSFSVPRTEEEHEASVGHSVQYCNLSSIPPAVDRALKPRHSSHTPSNVSTFVGNVSTYTGPVVKKEEPRPDRLQYLDLDLPSNTQDQRKSSIVHGKSLSSDADSAYKTVDFLKTEAFNITRQDAEASRSIQQ